MEIHTETKPKGPSNAFFNVQTMSEIEHECHFQAAPAREITHLEYMTSSRCKHVNKVSTCAEVTYGIHKDSCPYPDAWLSFGSFSAASVPWASIHLGARVCDVAPVH